METKAYWTAQPLDADRADYSAKLKSWSKRRIEEFENVVRNLGSSENVKLVGTEVARNPLPALLQENGPQLVFERVIPLCKEGSFFSYEGKNGERVLVSTFGIHHLSSPAPHNGEAVWVLDPDRVGSMELSFSPSIFEEVREALGSIPGIKGTSALCRRGGGKVTLMDPAPGLWLAEDGPQLVLERVMPLCKPGSHLRLVSLDGSRTATVWPRKVEIETVSQ